jgi:hypothetical protein
MTLLRVIFLQSTPGDQKILCSIQNVYLEAHSTCHSDEYDRAAIIVYGQLFKEKGQV